MFFGKKLVTAYTGLAAAIDSASLNLAILEREHLQTLSSFWFCAEEEGDDTKVELIEFLAILAFTRRLSLMLGKSLAI